MIQVHPIFQTPVFVSQFDGLTDAGGLVSYIRERCALTPGQFGAGEVVQSRYDLHEDPELAELRKRVLETVGTLATEVYRYAPGYVAEITSMWGNLQRPGAAFRTHCHFNNIFSGVFYLNEDERFPPITFWRPTETTLDPRKSEYNVFNQGSFRIGVKKDTMILFPAWLQHSVDVNPTDQDRLGISFNVMLRGDYYNAVM
jgi:uncharacterized protein (TIGR02466 family)